MIAIIRPVQVPNLKGEYKREIVEKNSKWFEYENLWSHHCSRNYLCNFRSS